VSWQYNLQLARLSDNLEHALALLMLMLVADRIDYCHLINSPKMLFLNLPT
jgi:hypothetical protein